MTLPGSAGNVSTLVEPLSAAHAHSTADIVRPAPRGDDLVAPSLYPDRRVDVMSRALEALMADKDQKSDWSDVSRAIQRTEVGTLPLANTQPSQHSVAALTPDGKAPDDPSGVIAQYKARKLQREFVLKHLKGWYDARLEVTQHQLVEAVRVKKAEASLVGEQLLARLNEQHLAFMMDLGLGNLDTRQKTLKKLGDQTAAALREISNRDWPPEIIQDQITQVMSWYKEFAAKLRQELGEQTTS